MLFLIYGSPPRTALEEVCGVHGVSQKDAVPLYLLINHIIWFMKGCHANKWVIPQISQNQESTSKEG